MRKKGKEDTRLLSIVLSVLIMMLIAQTFVFWLIYPSNESGVISEQDKIGVFTSEPSPASGIVKLTVVEGES